MDNFTKGQWGVAIQDWHAVVGSFETDTVVASVQGETRETMAANAHLIAAAPDLLAALKETRSALNLFYDSSEDDVTMRGVGDAMALADAAIAKARGE